jgi:hypothetical protein
MVPWEQPIVDGFKGLDSFFGYVSPYLLPILLIIFIGGLLVYAGKRLVVAVS